MGGKQVELEAQAKQVADEISVVNAAVEKNTCLESKLRTAEAEVRNFVEANADHEPDPEELRNAADPDTKQVLDCVAEELALEELLVGLDELFAAHKLTIEDFLREVRDVSRRQFLCRVQRQKAAAALSSAATAAVPAAVQVAAA